MCFRYTIDEHVTAVHFFILFFQLVVTHNLTGCFDQVCHDLIELRGVFGRNDRHAGLLFDCFPSIARDLTAGACNLDVFSQTFRRFLLGNLCCRGFRQNIENQLQRRHIVSQVFFLQTLEIFVLPRAHARPRFRDLVGQNRVFHAFLNAACVPFVGQFLAHLNCLQALVDPLAAVTFLEIGFQCAVDRQFRIDGFLDPFPANLRQPKLLFRKKDYTDFLFYSKQNLLIDKRFCGILSE